MDKCNYISQVLSAAIDYFLPSKSTRAQESDKPWITPRIRTLISRRQRALSKFGNDSPEFHRRRNEVQITIKKCKRNYYASKAKCLKESCADKWWLNAKSLSGSSISRNQWYHQLNIIDGTTISSVQDLCENINQFFGLTSPFAPLMPHDVNSIPVHEIPNCVLVTPREAYMALRAIKIKKAPGPDVIPNIILKLFAFELAPVVADLYNASLRERFLPSILKRASVCPSPPPPPRPTLRLKMIYDPLL